MNKKYWFDILVSAQDNAHLTGESTSLVCVQLKKWDFEKIFNKSDGDFQQLLCKNTVSEGCALCKKYLGDISVFWRFPICTRHFPLFLFLGLIFVQTAVLSKNNNCVF